MYVYPIVTRQQKKRNHVLVPRTIGMDRTRSGQVRRPILAIFALRRRTRPSQSWPSGKREEEEKKKKPPRRWQSRWRRRQGFGRKISRAVVKTYSRDFDVGTCARSLQRPRFARSHCNVMGFFFLFFSALFERVCRHRRGWRGRSRCFASESQGPAASGRYSEVSAPRLEKKKY